MAGKTRTLAKILNLNGKLKPSLRDSDAIVKSAVKGAGPSSNVLSHSSADTLNVSATNGDQAFITSTKRLYMYSNGGWYNIATVNTTPSFTTTPNNTYDLLTDGTATVITVLAVDSDDHVITYTAVTDNNFDAMATITKDSDNGRIFVIRSIDSETSASQVERSGTVTFKASDDISLASAVSTFNITFNYFIDQFTTNTTSNSEYVWTYTGTAWSWNSSGYVYINTGDNYFSQVVWTPSNGRALGTSGRAFVKFLKTADWPADNHSHINLLHTNGTDYYRVNYSGSAYQSTMTKTISDSVTDTLNVSYNFDDQTSYHTFELQWNDDTLKFYVDGTLQGTLVPSNNTTPIEISSISWYFNQIRGNLDAIGYQQYDSDSSAYPFV